MADRSEYMRWPADIPDMNSRTGHGIVWIIGTLWQWGLIREATAIRWQEWVVDQVMIAAAKRAKRM